MKTIERNIKNDVCLGLIEVHNMGLETRYRFNGGGSFSQVMARVKIVKIDSLTKPAAVSTVAVTYRFARLISFINNKIK